MNCSICLDDLTNDRCYLPCCHSFHSACISEWADVNGTCPTCRLNIALMGIVPGSTRLRINNALYRVKEIPDTGSIGKIILVGKSLLSVNIFYRAGHVWVSAGDPSQSRWHPYEIVHETIYRGVELDGLMPESFSVPTNDSVQLRSTCRVKYSQLDKYSDDDEKDDDEKDEKDSVYAIGDFVEKIRGRGRGQTGIIVGFLSNGKCRVRQVDGVTWNAQSPSNFRLKTIWGHK